MPFRVLDKLPGFDRIRRIATIAGLSALALCAGAGDAGAFPKPANKAPNIRRVLNLYNPASLSFLSNFENPSVEHLSSAQAFLFGPWGIRTWTDYCPESYSVAEVSSNWMEPMAAIADDPLLALSWRPRNALVTIPIEGAAASKGLELRLNRAPFEPESLRFSLTSAQAPLFEPPPCLRKAVTFVRYGAETDKFSLLKCDGSIAPEAIDRLSVVARPVTANRPELPLREIPDPDATHGEWEPSIKLVNPRLVWILQGISDAFPNRAIYIISGYRRGEHEGMHGQARGVDLIVMGVAKDRLYKFCRSLPDAGCGYYPNHDFVHVDVRPPGTGKAFWIDVSFPGKPSEYVDGWAGVEAQGALSWMQNGRGGVGD